MNKITTQLENFMIYLYETSWRFYRLNLIAHNFPKILQENLIILVMHLIIRNTSNKFLSKEKIKNPNSKYFVFFVTHMKNSDKSMIDPYQKAGKFLKLKKYVPKVWRKIIQWIFTTRLKKPENLSHFILNLAKRFLAKFMKKK